MQNYNILIAKAITQKYKSSTIRDKNLIKKYFKQRKIFLKTIYNKKNQFGKNNHNYSDDTAKKICTIYYKKNKNKDDLKILKYYKKFEFNLSLKKKYKNFQTKLSNSETLDVSYIYLGLLVYKNRYLNKYQKLNAILKIIDKLSQKKNFSGKINLLLLERLIKIENILINKIK